MECRDQVFDKVRVGQGGYVGYLTRWRPSCWQIPLWCRLSGGRWRWWWGLSKPADYIFATAGDLGHTDRSYCDPTRKMKDIFLKHNLLINVESGMLLSDGGLFAWKLYFLIHWDVDSGFVSGFPANCCWEEMREFLCSFKRVWVCAQVTVAVFSELARQL